MITAKFIGNDSNGFVKNNIYDIDIKTRGGYIWILCQESKKCCPYSSLDALSLNWVIPVTPLGKFEGKNENSIFSNFFKRKFFCY